VKKKSKRDGSAAATEASGGEGAPEALPLPTWLRVIAYAVPTALAMLLLGLFARALPAALQRAKLGEQAAHAAACDALQPAPGNQKLGMLPTEAPDFALKNWAGQETRLSSLRGNVVLVNFWATWCSTCVVEMPSMERLVEHMKGKPFRLLAVSVDDDWPQVRKFFAKGTPLEVLLDAKRAIPTKWGTEKFPESFLVDKEGTIRYYIVSNRDWSTPAVEACLDALID
jgi:peroxiredoxin